MAAWGLGLSPNFPFWKTSIILLTLFTGVDATCPTIENGVAHISSDVQTKQYINCAQSFSLEVAHGVSIGEYAFKNCANLMSVMIGNGVTLVSGAFKNCDAVKTVVIGNHVTIGIQAFQHSKGIKSIAIGDYSSVATAAFQGEGEESALVSLTLGIGTTLGVRAFEDNGNLVTVTLPVDTTLIPTQAFEDCELLTGLNWIDMPQLTEIGANAFKDTAVNLPLGLGNIIRLGEDGEKWVEDTDKCRLYKKGAFWEVKSTCCHDLTPYLTDKNGCVSVCPKGTIPSAGSTHQQCDYCELGTEVIRGACAPCTGGKFNNVLGSGCQDCPAGK